MRIQRSLLVLCLFATVVCLVGMPQKAKACEGHPDSFAHLYQQHEILAKGTVIQTDTMQQSALIHVETYYKGSGSEYLLWARLYTNELQNLLAGNPDCQGWEDPLFVGDNIYFFASRRLDGSYDNPGYGYNTLFRYNAPNATDTVYLDDYQAKSYTEKQLQQLIAKTSKQRPVHPVKDNRIPLPSLLLIFTQKSKYILPIDGQPPLKLKLENPQLILENPPNVYTLEDSESVAWSLNKFYYYAIDAERCFTKNCKVYDTLTRYIKFAPESGKPDYDAALFSPEQSLLAIWTATELQVQNAIYGEYFLNKVVLHNDAKNTALKLAHYAYWSADGQLAYSDLDGLWVWEANRQGAIPRLVKSTDKDGVIPLARYFSPRGRYLAISEGNKLSTIDLRTDREFPDGLVSPDDKLLLAFDKKDSQNGLVKINVCNLSNEHCYKLYDADFDKVKQIEWLTNRRFLALVDPYQDNEDITRNKFDVATGYLLRDEIADLHDFSWIEYGPLYIQEKTQPTKAFSFVYEPASQTLALLTNKSTLVINKRLYDFGQYLDGDIVSMRWLPPLLYRESP